MYPMLKPWLGSGGAIVCVVAAVRRAHPTRPEPEARAIARLEASDLDYIDQSVQIFDTYIAREEHLYAHQIHYDENINE